MATARQRARQAALVYLDSRFNTGQRGALEHAADATSDVYEPLVRELAGLLKHFRRTIYADPGLNRSLGQQRRHALDRAREALGED